MAIRPSQLVLRCYAEHDAGTWFAMCLDLNLYARGDTFEEARRKLHQIVYEYVSEAVTEDDEHRDDLIPRRAPLYFWARYYLAVARFKLHLAIRRLRKQFILFTEHLPLKPA